MADEKQIYEVLEERAFKELEEYEQMMLQKENSLHRTMENLQYLREKAEMTTLQQTTELQRLQEMKEEKEMNHQHRTEKKELKVKARETMLKLEMKVAKQMLKLQETNTPKTEMNSVE